MLRPKDRLQPMINNVINLVQLKEHGMKTKSVLAIIFFLIFLNMFGVVHISNYYQRYRKDMF